jgi:hypothetical protein
MVEMSKNDDTRFGALVPWGGAVPAQSKKCTMCKGKKFIRLAMPAPGKIPCPACQTEIPDTILGIDLE